MDIPTPIENRLVDLEIKAGFTEDLLDQLSAQVYRQQQQIDALIQELRKMGIPAQETHPSRNNDKISRVNARADLFASGMVWAPDTRWAREVIEEVASFPNGDNDDYVDTTSQALLRFRQGGFIALDSDEKDEPRFYRRRARAYY